MTNSEETIKVTIGITTYNLERYIAQALDSVLAQQTRFKFSILVVDDASTDGTTRILKEYESRYPSRIRVIYQETNGGSLHASNILFNNIKTEYLAFLDGDDYWLTTDRLQKQIDFLDAHKEYSMCGGNTQYLNEGASGQGAPSLVVPMSMTARSYNFEDFLTGGAPFVHTSSIVYRNSIFAGGVPKEYEENEKTIFNCAYRGEDVRFIAHLQLGPIYVDNSTVSVYRIHSMGIWQGKSQLRRNLEAVLSQYKFSCVFGGGKLEEPIFRNSFKRSYREVFYELARGGALGETEIALLNGLFESMLQSNIDWSFTCITHREQVVHGIKDVIYGLHLQKLAAKLLTTVRW